MKKDIPEWALHKAAQLWCLPRHSHKEMDSEFAEDIALALVEAKSSVDRKAELESLIRGHMEAMRPLLDEWAKS